MPRRSPPPTDRSAAIERRMVQLRHIAARAEAEACIGSDFGAEGRPLSPDDLRFHGPDGALIDADESDPYPPATKRAFWMGAVVAAAVLAAMMWFGPW